MKKSFKSMLFMTALLAIGTLVACSQTSQTSKNVQSVRSEKALAQTMLLANLPLYFNSPASLTIDNNNNILFTSPNLHNDAFVKQGIMKKAESPTIGLIDANNKVSIWYTFLPKDMEPKSGTIVPMGIAKGPDGNIYVADMQLWAGGESRVLRLSVKEGNAVNVEVVAKGFSFPNALAWKGNDLFISDTVLATVKGKSTTSGIYKINLNELNAKKPLQITSYESKNNFDQHLIETFQSNGSLGFGANGLAVDEVGNLYTGIMEEGIVYKTTLNEDHTPKATTLFAKGMIAPDGIQWDHISKALYATDLFANAVYRIDLNGELTLLAKNGDTDGANGEIDGPGEVIIRGNKAYVTNFDAAFGVPKMVNTKPDAPSTISVFKLK